MTKPKATRARRASPKSTRRNIAAEILNGLEEAIRFEKGEETGAVFKAAPISAGMATVDPAPELGARRIAAVRAK